jgi:hypothetical protein
MRAQNLIRPILILSVLSFLVTIPHAVEDFLYGVPQQFGVPTPLAGLVLGLGYAIQVIGVIGVARGQQWGLLITFFVSLGWMLGAALDHLPDVFSAEPFREGAVSRLLVTLILLVTGGLTVLSGVALRRGNR